nr:importin-5-like [Ipomoea batatas]
MGTLRSSNGHGLNWVEYDKDGLTLTVNVHDSQGKSCKGDRISRPQWAPRRKDPQVLPPPDLRYAPLTVSLPVSPFSPSHSDDASLHHEPPPPPQPPTPPSTLRCHRLPCEDADAATTSAPALTVDSPTASPLASPLRGCAAACPPPPTASSPPVLLCLGPRQLIYDVELILTQTIAYDCPACLPAITKTDEEWLMIQQAYAAWTMSNFCQNCCSNILKPYLKEIITKLLMFLQIDSGYTPVGAVVARGISLNLVAQEIELEAKF